MDDSATDFETPSTWTELAFDTWQASKYTIWIQQQQQSAAIAASPITTATTTATQLATDRFVSQDYRKIQKNEKDYNLLKHEEHSLGKEHPYINWIAS